MLAAGRRSGAASAGTAATVCARAVSRSCSSPLILRCNADASYSSACPSLVWAATHARVTSGRVTSSSRPATVSEGIRSAGDVSPRLKSMWDWVLPAYRNMGRNDPEDRYGWRRGNVAKARPTKHHSAVTTEVTRATGTTITAWAAPSNSPGSDAAGSYFGLGRCLAPGAPVDGGRTLAIRHRSTSGAPRTGARAPGGTGDRPRNSKPAIPAHRPPSTSSKPAAAVTGAVSRYSDSTSVRRPIRTRNLAPGHHRPRTAAGHGSVMAPA